MSISIVYNEDCLIGMKRFCDNYFDMAICDIPYGIDVANMPYLKEINTRVRQKNGSLLNARRNKKTYVKKDWDKSVPKQDYFDELRRISKNQIIFGVEYVDWDGLGSGRIKWNKGVADNMSFKSYELIYCSLFDNSEIEIQLLWSGMMQAKSLKEPMTQQGNKKLNEKRIHPCQKPRLLYRKLFMDYCIEGMKILDTYVGSGSSRIEADLANCDFVGFEIEKDYWLDQELRFMNYKKQLKLKF